jgi:hypothetical protein
MKEAQAAVTALEEELREQAYEAGLELQTRFRVVPHQYHKVCWKCAVLTLKAACSTAHQH